MPEFSWKKLAFLLSLSFTLVVGAIVLTLWPAEKNPDLSVKPGFVVAAHAEKSTYAVLEVVNKGDGSDKVVGASVAPSVATRAELHTMTNNAMVKVSEVAVPADSNVLFTGSPHVMLVDLKGHLNVGEKVDITLDFEKSDNITSTFLVTQADGHNHKH